MTRAGLRPTAVERVAAALLLAGASAQLVGHSLGSGGLAETPSDDLWTEVHVLLVLSVTGLLAGSLCLAGALAHASRGRAILGATTCVAGYGCALATFAHDLSVVGLSRSALSALDLLDLLGVAGTVTLLLAVATRAPRLAAGAWAAAVGLAVPMTGGLVVAASVAVVAGFGALALAVAGLLPEVADGRRALWLLLLAFGIAGLVSWPRAALAAYVGVLVVLDARGLRRSSTLRHPAPNSGSPPR